MGKRRNGRPKWECRTAEKEQPLVLHGGTRQQEGGKGGSKTTKLHRNTPKSCKLHRIFFPNTETARTWRSTMTTKFVLFSEILPFLSFFIEDCHAIILITMSSSLSVVTSTTFGIVTHWIKATRTGGCMTVRANIWYGISLSRCIIGQNG